MTLLLYRGTPPWLGPDGATAPNPPVVGDLATEIAVVGAGISGALVAYQLAKNGIAAVVVDRRPAAMGSTFASTALLSYEMDVHLADLLPRMGERDATRVYELGRQSIGRIEEIAAEVGGSVDFHRRACFFFARNRREAADIRREYKARRAHGFDIGLLTRKEIEATVPFSRPLATRTPEAAEVDPVKLTRSALAYALHRGARLYTDTVARFRPEPPGVRLETENGGTISARRVILATGYETKQFADIPEARLSSTYVLATTPVGGVAGWPDRALICEAGDPYTYLRTMPDNRIMIGGEDEDFSDPDKMRAALPPKVAKLESQLRAMFPALSFEVESAWAGVFSSTTDGLPFIGAHPDFPGALFALGYGGNGITFAAIAAEIIRDEILGRPNPDARLFRFGRG